MIKWTAGLAATDRTPVRYRTVRYVVRFIWPRSVCRTFTKPDVKTSGHRQGLQIISEINGRTAQCQAKVNIRKMKTLLQTQTKNAIEYLFLRQETCKGSWQTLLNVDRYPVLIGTKREKRVKEAFERHDTSTPLITACQQIREPQPSRRQLQRGGGGCRRVRTEQLVRT